MAGKRIVPPNEGSDAPDAEPEGTGGVPPSKKGGPPTFPAPQGIFEVDYRHHDGRIIIGQGDWAFTTHWGPSSNGSIYVYRGDGVLVAVAPLAHEISDVTPEVVDAANFSSRYRHPEVGEVVLFLNENGYAAAIQVHKVTLTAESRPGTALVAKYRILTDETLDFSTSQPADLRRLAAAAEEALASLSELDPPSEPAFPGGIGHNNPPSDAALTPEDFVELKSLLQRLSSSSAAPEEPELVDAQESLRTTGQKITAWVAERTRLINEGYYRELGASAAKASLAIAGATIAGAWLIFTGKLNAVLMAIYNVGRALFGWT